MWIAPRGQMSTAWPGKPDKMFLSTLSIRGRARQETNLRWNNIYLFPLQQWNLVPIHFASSESPRPMVLYNTCNWRASPGPDGFCFLELDERLKVLVRLPVFRLEERDEPPEEGSSSLSMSSNSGKLTKLGIGEVFMNEYEWTNENEWMNEWMNESRCLWMNPVVNE